MFSHSSDLVSPLVWLLITFLSFQVIYFLFLFSLNWLLVCVVNALIKAEIEDQSVRGQVDGHSWL
jgi:F0F1-type ATP synthase assembly protein I